VTMDNGFRWLTVNPPDQPDLEIILFPSENNGFDEEVNKALKLLLEKGAMGAGAMYTPDCRATYEELKAKGVVFKSEPKEQFYGIEAIITDGCGNWFSMTQPKDGL
jgi:Glyoxalase/Bleomycin resistance protein/Dioxygenase superfamily